MLKQVSQSDQAPRPIGPYSQAIRCGEYVFSSGQIPLDPATGSLVGESIVAQTRQVLTNLEAVLRAAGTSLSHAVKTTVFLTDLADFTAMNSVYAEFFPEMPPARTTVQVSALPGGARVEMEVVACIQ